MAKNLAVNHLPLEAVPAVQTANVTTRPWSRDILRFAVCGFSHEKPDAKGLYYNAVNSPG